MSIISNRVLVVIGPTAVGKTATVERLAQDDRLHAGPVVVVSADSVQAYKGLDIGSAKPSLGERTRLPHELIDIIDPSEPYSVADFLTRADEACERAVSTGALPILSGGTAYYVKAFLYGLPPAPKADPAIRKALAEELCTRGPEPLRAELASVDPISAARIAPADLYRLTRALEVYRSTGQALSSFELPSEPRSRWDCLVIGLDRPRDELYARIEARVDVMMSLGLRDEVLALIRDGYGPEAPGMRAIGYAEFLSGSADPVADIKKHTRQYAKRQLTFMRAIPGVRWFQADDYDGMSAAVASWLGARV